MGWDANGDDGDCKKKWMEEEEDEEDDSREESFSDGQAPPDGGWGWLVVLSSFLCNMIIDGICFSFGILIYVYMKNFNDSHSKVSWIGSMLSGSYLLAGPFVSLLCAHYGCRKVTIFGSLVSMVGFALSTQATNTEMMIVCHTIAGVGFGMIYLPSIVSVGHWFDKKRAFTTGIAVSGSGLGQAFFPPLVYYLLTTYKWQGMNLILAGIAFNCAVAGATFRPLDRHTRKRKPINSRVAIERGVIMKALIEQKQRTISNGSLDNCVITRDNKLIKLDPALMQCKRNNSVLARFKRQLGFSAQSLSISKSSFQDIHNFVMGAVNSKNNTSAAYQGGDIRLQPCQGSSTPDVYICAPQANGAAPTLLVNGASALPNGNAATPNHPPGFPKTRSCDALCRHGQQAEAQAAAGVNGACSLTDLPSTPILPSMLETSVISIQVVPNCVADSQSIKYSSRQNFRQRSSHSTCSEYTPSTAGSSHPTFVSASVTSMPQIQSMVDLSQSDTIWWKSWRVFCDMFDVKLLLNPKFTLLVISSFLSLLAFHVPYFFLPEQGIMLGMTDEEATFLLSIMGVTNTFGRFLGGWLADRPVINSLYLNNASLILVGLFVLIIPVCKTHGLLALMAALSAFFYGIFIALRSILLVDLLGLDLLTKSFGMLILFQGVAAMIGPPIAGKLADETGNLNTCFIVAGIITIISGLLIFPSHCLRSQRQAVDEDRNSKQMNGALCIGGKIITPA